MSYLPYVKLGDGKLGEVVLHFILLSLHGSHLHSRNGEGGKEEGIPTLCPTFQTFHYQSKLLSSKAIFLMDLIMLYALITFVSTYTKSVIK